MTTRDPAPWLALCATLLDGLRPSPARRALSVALRAAGRRLGPRSESALRRWATAASAAIRTLPEPPPVPHARELVLLHACALSLDAPWCSDVGAALGLLILELEDEIRGAARARVSVHATDRYRAGVDPEATELEATATLYRLLGSAAPSGRARDCAVWVSPEAPSVQLRVRDRTVVTVTTVAGQVARRERARWVA